MIDLTGRRCTDDGRTPDTGANPHHASSIKADLKVNDCRVMI